VFEKKGLRTILGSRRDEVTKDLQKLLLLYNLIMVKWINQEGIRWAGCIGCMKQDIHTKFLSEKPQKPYIFS
jgi:hypothetical protein